VRKLSWTAACVIAFATGGARAQGAAGSPDSALGGAGAGVERLGLAEAVQRALARNPSAAIARADVRRAEAIVREVRAAALPGLTGSATYTHLDDERRLGDRVVAGRDQLGANVTLAVPIAAPQRWVQWSHASDNVEVASANAHEVRRQVAVATARAYLAVLAQRRIVEAIARSRDTAKAHRQFSSSLLAGGAGNRIDLVRAEQEWATAEAQLAAALAGLVRTREALGVLVGATGAVDARDEVGLPAPAPSPAGAELEASARRPDVRALWTRVRAAENVVRDGWADYAPLLVGAFQPFYQNPPSLVQPLTGWQAQLVLTVPLYDGGLRYGQADEREALLADARARLDGALRQAKSEVRSAFESVRRSDEALVAARRAARLAAEALALATLAYEAGATTNIEVVDAERRARDAETQVAVAEDGARQARLDLLAASGRFP
jgi:outer membrane protein TolC